MKALLFSLAFCCISSLRAQTEPIDEIKSLRFGFNLGLQQSFLNYGGDLPANTDIDNALGYRLGILAKYQHKYDVFAVLRTELAVNHSSLMYSDSAGLATRYDVAPTTIQTAFHLGYSMENMNVKPFIYGGVNYKYPFQQNIDKSSTFPSGEDLALEIGIGLKKKFEYFDLMPEIRYSHGLNNVNRNPMFQSISVNELSFSLIFM